MESFIKDNFLLSNKTSEYLYHSYAKTLPIIDYHCHLSPMEIATNKSFCNITELWLSGDHYKWRLMRSAGISEQYITGDASPKDKFMSWAKVIGKAIGNPLYHWNCLELKKYFDINEPLNISNAEKMWNQISEKMSSEPNKYTARELIKSSNVEIIATTDDPIDDLAYHKIIKDDPTIEFKVLPSFRPDLALNIEGLDFITYIKKLSKVTNICINSLSDLSNALDKRIDYFHDAGCRLSDHGLEKFLFIDTTYEEANSIFLRRMDSSISPSEATKFKSYLLSHLATSYYKHNWNMQLHFGCIRDTNSIMLSKLGNNVGCDSITGEYDFVSSLTTFIDKLISIDSLPRIILYSLNPNDNPIIDTLIGCYQGNGKLMNVQHGAAWWFNDNLEGIISFLKSFSSLSYLPGFLGMLTDSRSFLSYTRHEYFRRIFCDFLGKEVHEGRFPFDEEILKEIIEAVSYNNARSLFE